MTDTNEDRLDLDQFRQWIIEALPNYCTTDIIKNVIQGRLEILMKEVERLRDTPAYKMYIEEAFKSQQNIDSLTKDLALWKNALSIAAEKYKKLEAENSEKENKINEWIEDRDRWIERHDALNKENTELKQKLGEAKANWEFYKEKNKELKQKLAEGEKKVEEQRKWKCNVCGMVGDLEEKPNIVRPKNWSG